MIAFAEHKSKVHGSFHWIAERGLSIALLGLFPAAFIIQDKSIDYAIGALLPAHAYLGLQSSITDYLHQRKFPVINFISINTLRVATLGLFYGLYKLNSQDVGITETLKKLWRLH